MKTNPLLKKTIVITGTHLTPAVELINQLKGDSKTNWEIHYIGRRYNSSIDCRPSIESQIIPKLGIKFYQITCGKLDRKWLFNTIKGVPDTIKGFFQAFILVNKINPDIVVSFGGYVSVPVIISSWLRNIPSITHEQTLTNSLTTKINSLFVTKIALSFNNENQIKTLPSKKIIVTGNLLRSQVFNPNLSSLPKLIKTNSNTPVIYITAGNQGSIVINKEVRSILNDLRKFIIIHQVGSYDWPEYKDLSKIYTNYYPFEYIDQNDIGWVLNNAKIVISRSGANTSQEIVALQKSSILIPLPKSQQNEQVLNAKWVKQNLPENTIVIFQDKLTCKKLLKSINQLNKTLSSKINKPSSATNLKLLNLINEIN